MRDIAATCPACRETSTAQPITYLVWVADRPDRNFYTFTCTRCAVPAAIWLDPVVERMLVMLGVKRRPYTTPLEVDDPQRQERTPLTVDDLLDLMNELHDREDAL